MNDLPQYETFGQRLQHGRKAAGLTLKALAARTGININILSRYERNRQQPSDPDRFTKLADALGVPSGWLVEPTITLSPGKEEAHEEV